MKHIYIKITGVVLLLGLVSCDSQLDLEPTDTFVETDIFATLENAESAIFDIYQKQAVAGTGLTHTIGDASLASVAHPSLSSITNYYGGDLTALDSGVEDIWRKYYQAINVANVFIDKVPIFGQYDEAKELQHIAEAKFNRAYSYLVLLSYFGDKSLIDNPEGLGLPLQLTPYDGFTTSDLIPRNTNEEVFQQIIKDLNEAVADLPNAYSSNLESRARATKTSAYALLSRVYLYKRNYQACVEASNKVIANTNYELDPDLLNLFPLNEDGVMSKFSDEVIFGFPFSSNGSNFQYGSHGIYYRSRNVMWVNSDFIESMEPSDKRRTELIYAGNPLSQSNVNEKTTFKYNNPEQRDDIIVIRLAEIILNKAEALVQLNGVNSESVSLLNQIRERSNIDPVSISDFATVESLLDAIHTERYFETAFEGRGRFDFIRTGRPLRNPDLTPEQQTFPIPQREIDLSLGILVQNPGYN